MQLNFFYVIKVQKSLFEANCPFPPYFSQKMVKFQQGNEEYLC